MPIRALDFLLQDKKLVQEAPLSALRDTRLGIDATLYVRRLLTSSETKEAYVPALGGVPLALEEHILRDLRALEKEHIKPIFVFNGLAPQKSGSPRERSAAAAAAEDTRPAKRQIAWEHYEKGRNQAALAAFQELSMNVADVLRVVHRCFMHRKTEFITAPYLAWAQLVYLERSPKQYTHATWSSTEFLMFEGVERLILDMDLKNSTFTFVTKQDILKELALTSEQFLDMGILAGFYQSPSLPIVDWSLKAVLALLERYKSAPTALLAISQDPSYPNNIQQSGYFESYARAKTLIKFSLVLAAEEGRILPLPIAIPPQASLPALKHTDIPSDIQEVFSYRLPDELYFHLFRGLVSPQILGALTSGLWVEQAPLCGGESDEYRRFSRDIMTEHPQSPRCTALGLLSQCLNPFWQQRTVTAVSWFAPDKEYIIQHNSPAVTKSLERMQYWNVPSAVIEEELRRQKSSTIDIRLCLGATASGANYAARTKVPKNPKRLLEKKDEIVANSLWRFLELRGFLNPNHTPTAHGKALYGALEQSRVNDKFQDPLYLALELVRAGVLHNGKFGNRTWSGGASLGGEKDKANAMLVMRVLSIVALNFKPEAWTGPMSRSLLVFNSFLRCLSTSLRSLIEMTTVNLILKGDCTKNRQDFLEITLSLPFSRVTNSGMGILWKAWCDACAHVGMKSGLGKSEDMGGFAVTPQSEDQTEGKEDSQAVKDKKAALENVKATVSTLLEKAFANVRDVRHELARGVRFWDTVMTAMRILHAEGPNAIPPELFQTFEDANRWLEPFRP